MVITNRELTTGTVLVAKHKKQEYEVEVVEPSLFRRRDTGEQFKSLSAAGSSIMNGIACNGWRFFSLLGGTASPAAESTPEPVAEAAPEAEPTPVEKPAITRTPNQKGVPEGSVRWYCQKAKHSFIAGTEMPTACPDHG